MRSNAPALTLLVGTSAAVVALAVTAVLVLHGPSGRTTTGDHSAREAGTSLVLGTSPPSFQAPSVVPGQAPVTSAAWKGRPAVLNFFASWCRGCAQELPVLSRASAGAAGRVVFVGVDADDSGRVVRPLLHAAHVRYPVGADPDDAVTLRYGLVDLPTTVFITRRDTVAGVHVGPLTRPVLDRWLARLTAAA